MNSAPDRPRDPNQLGKLVVDLATGEAEDEVKQVNISKRNAGIIGGNARSVSISSERRSEIARAGADARWKKRAAG
ncbi:MAG: histone H1 [Aestuariivita sp.]|nr:histone H1 [Aestuariivita sp.]